jgi:GNAT superfamily N-acetyltransferase
MGGVLGGGLVRPGEPSVRLEGASAMQIVGFRPELTEAVLAAWRRSLTFSEIDEARFRRSFVDDPHVPEGGVVVALGRDGTVLGFAGCACPRRSADGAEAGGWAWRRVYLKAFFAEDGEQEAASATALLGAVDAVAEASGLGAVRLCQYMLGPAPFPGLDLRYQRLQGLLMRHRYRDVMTIEDVGVALTGPLLPRQFERARERAGSEVHVVTWTPELLPAMRRFVAAGEAPHFFREGWEQGYREADEQTLVVIRGEVIVGWARYRPDCPAADFGPTLVLPQERGRGYGALLLWECADRARAVGAERVEARWANTGFYIRQGWQIIRRYAVLEKDLRPE